MTYFVIIETKYSEGRVIYVAFPNNSNHMITYTPNREKAWKWVLDKKQDCIYYCEYLNKTTNNEFEFNVLRCKE